MCWKNDPKQGELNIDYAVTSKNIVAIPVDLVFESGKVDLSFEPFLFTWNYKIPVGGDLKKWRFGQLRRYLDTFPDHKPKPIFK